MGMDYYYAGSASYPRFNSEVCAVAEVFGGIKKENIKALEFVFPEGTSETLVKWFNNIYDEFTAEETKEVWGCVSKHPEIKDISSQIWRELEYLVEDNEGWSIY